MKKQLLHTVIATMLALSVGMFQSCDKYLDVQSNSGLQVPNTLESFQKLLDASYFVNVNMCSNGEVSADDYFLKETSYDMISEDARDIYLWRNENYVYNNDWAKAYIPVYTTNLILDGLKDVGRTSDNGLLWDQVYGSALYVRASQFLSLVWVFGKAYTEATAATDLGIVIRETSDPNVPSERATIGQTYDVILKDLKAAGEHLPTSAAHVMRPSKAAAYGSLARAYLSMGQFDSAYHYADKALDINSRLLDFNGSAEINPTAAFPFSRFNAETIYYVQLANTYPHLNPFYGLIDSALYDSYEDGDLRKTLYFNRGIDGYVSFKGSYSNTTDLFAGITTGELYLVRAECSARLGDTEGALADLNNLLVTRWCTGTYVPYVVDSKEAVIDVILQERRKELLMRGLRWIDIKRLNLMAPEITMIRKMKGQIYTLEPNDLRYALPLPQDIITITGIPQNER
ncbi:RagB/SusD family nutrient uptake outer membrane protein [Sphingobacterium alkalisoli]|uniref:RagB/SusD family nutrient uptake outer membrane protein n=1 Tax=Sphingobacterium alkalisoli TaxID=1874115 RepID=A0A4U0H5Q7_9SPHI|nr:RagB/SusD family nutrient uptake outer membrane protein [Sphingobacterium alkalisoli]TJY66544.1 RagB/SusD family nutrient uptake outer membrane protein [Sphingobacterium alkalisoli]GGH15737.1 hypothetical protein GCM10011418_17650 [Sphingobacterium alkalisoli]